MSKPETISKKNLPDWVDIAFNKLPQAALVLNTQTLNIEYLNKVAIEEYGATLELDASLFFIKNLGIDPGLSARIIQRIQAGLTVQQSIENKSSQREWIQLKIEPLGDKTGQALIQLFDQSDSVKSEETLIKEIQKFEALFNFATMGILLVNSTGNIVMSNPHANKQFGYGTGELLGQTIETLIPLRFRERHGNHREKYNQKPESRSMGTGLDLFAMRKNKTEFPVQISLGQFENEEGKFTLAFVVDDTDRKQKEKAIIQQKEEMAEANKRIKQMNEMLEFKVAERTRMLQETMKELEQSRDDLSQALEKEKQLNDMKSRFVSMASHEFRTPLSTILSSITLLSKYITTEEQTRRDKHIDRIKSSVSNLTEILNEFLSLGKIEDGKVEPRWTEFSLPEHVISVIKQLETICKPGQEIIYNHAGEEMADLDPSLLKNVFINLINNAIKFSPERKPIQVNTVVNEIGIQISIKDEGLGISKEDQQHLFERFFRGNNVTNIQGTGLGLHIVSRYIQLMKGTIECQSELESGTTFHIFFPRRSKEQKEECAV